MPASTVRRSAGISTALLGLVLLVVFPCLTLLLPAPAVATPARQTAFDLHAPAMSASAKHPRSALTSLTIGSFNIRYSNDATYDSARSTLHKLKRVLSLSGSGSGSRRGSPAAAAAAGETGGSGWLPKQNWGERSWFLRGPYIADTVLFYDWDLFAMQEVLDAQYVNMAQWLGDEYDHVGVGRNDGKRAGEAVPLFWRRDRLTRVPASEGGVGPDGVEHFWLSETPDKVGSVGWDADLTRMCTHVALRLHDTNELIHVFSTHYDHKGLLARQKSSDLILHRARIASASASHNTQSPPLIILIGDLNSPRNQPAWAHLVAGHYHTPHPPSSPHAPTFLDTALSLPTRDTSPYLTDNESPQDAALASGAQAPPTPNTNVTAQQQGQLWRPWGPLRTFTNFHPSDRDAVADRIDFIMLLDNGAVRDQTRNDTVLQQHSNAKAGTSTDKKNDGPWSIRTFGILPNWSQGDAGFLTSDHRPVMTRIQRRV